MKGKGEQSCAGLQRLSEERAWPSLSKKCDSTASFQTKNEGLVAGAEDGLKLNDWQEGD